MHEITSAQNPKIKYLARLVAQRRARQQEGRFVAEGLRLCEEAVRSGIEIEELYFSAQAAARYGQRLEQLLDCGAPVYELADTLTHKISDTQAPQGVFCLCRMPQRLQPKLRSAGRYLALEDLQDPGNLGTIVRTAEALGLDAVVATASCPDRFGPKVLRSSMGSVFRLPVFEVPDLATFIRQSGLHSYAACLDDQAQPLSATAFLDGVLVAVGNEGNGLSDTVIDACEQKLYIDMAGPTESLNASVAASILMWEMCKTKTNREGERIG